MKQTHLRVGSICAVKRATALEAAIAIIGRKVRALSFGSQEPAGKGSASNGNSFIFSISCESRRLCTGGTAPATPGDSVGCGMNASW